MAKITYTDKVSTEVDPTIPEINKITDANMNEIKSVVNDNYDYSIYIGDEADATSDTKLLIETDTLASLGTEITNTYSTSQVLGYSANYVNTLNTYSTTEQRIGTWMTGKPIYRKCFEVQTPSYSTAPYDYAWMDVTDLNISVVTDLKAIIFNNNAMFITPFAYDVGNSAHISLYYNRSTKKIQFASNTTTYNSLASRVIIEYTKTTD